MIKGIVIVNNNGYARLVKLFTKTDFKKTQSAIREIYTLVSRRSGKLCNFVDKHTISFFGDDTRLIYRHYATLYFVFACDKSESELAILDLIQVFVETLDKCFENVCELDLIFHSEKVHYILDEIVMGGMVLETNISLVLKAVREMQKLQALATAPEAGEGGKQKGLTHQKMAAINAVTGAASHRTSTSNIGEIRAGAGGFRNGSHVSGSGVIGASAGGAALCVGDGGLAETKGEPRSRVSASTRSSRRAEYDGLGSSEGDEDGKTRSAAKRAKKKKKKKARKKKKRKDGAER
jgi:AP-3 complex subunit sigma